MATNITTDNLQTADTLESLGAGTESGSFLICGKGSKLYQLPFERLRKNVNDGVIIPVKTEDKAIYNELFIASEIESVEEKLFNDFSINVDFSKDGNIVVMNNTAFIIDKSGIPYKVDLTNNTVERLSDNSFMAVIACRDYALFIHKYEFLSITFGVNVHTGEIIHAADTLDASIESMLTSATLTRVQNNNYPFDDYNGVMMYDNVSVYTYFYFTCSADGWAFKYQSQDYAEVEAATGQKQKDVIFLMTQLENDGVYMPVDEKGVFLSLNNNALYADNDANALQLTCNNLLNILYLYIFRGGNFSDGEIMIIENEKIIIINMLNGGIVEEKSVYFDDTVKPEIISVQTFDNETLFALQKTSKSNTYAIVKYSLAKDTPQELVFINEVVKTIQSIIQVQNFVLDPISMQQYIDGTILEPSIMLVGVCDNYGSLGVSHSETTYKQTLKIKLADGVKTLTE